MTKHVCLMAYYVLVSFLHNLIGPKTQRNRLNPHCCVILIDCPQNDSGHLTFPAIIKLIITR